jgi:hypothetical protein
MQVVCTSVAYVSKLKDTLCRRLLDRQVDFLVPELRLLRQIVIYDDFSGLTGKIGIPHKREWGLHACDLRHWVPSYFRIY